MVVNSYVLVQHQMQIRNSCFIFRHIADLFILADGVIADIADRPAVKRKRKLNAKTRQQIFDKIERLSFFISRRPVIRSITSSSSSRPMNAFTGSAPIKENRPLLSFGSELSNKNLHFPLSLVKIMTGVNTSPFSLTILYCIRPLSFFIEMVTSRPSFALRLFTSAPAVYPSLNRRVPITDPGSRLNKKRPLPAARCCRTEDVFQRGATSLERI